MTTSNDAPHALVTSLLTGLGVGAAIATVHLGNGIGLIVALGQPPHTWFAIQAVLIELAFAVAVGVLLTPVVMAAGRERGSWLVAALMIVFWLGLERWVAVDPAKPLMWLAGPVLGGVFYAIGAEVVRRHPQSAPRSLTLGVLALHVGLLAVPELVAMGASDASVATEVPDDRPAAREGAPDVLFVVMDTVRAQSTSTYGYERETTPVLTQFASEGLRFDQATAPATWSLPAHASLFTGTFPSVHQAHGETRFLDERLPTLMETFQQAGYETRCFSANPHISASFGLTRGFDGCDRAWASGEGARQFTFAYRLVDHLGFGVDDKGGHKVVGNLRRFMGSRSEQDRPAFVFVNFLEAHFPFHQLPPEFLTAYQDRPAQELRHADTLAFGAQMGRVLSDDEIAGIRGPMIDMYDGGVRYTDHLVGQVLDIWRDAGTLDETVVVVLGDHGEVVGEHSAFGHLSAVVEEDLRVPLVFRYPPRVPAGVVVDHPVTAIGTFATLTDLAEVPTPETVLVPSLLGAIADVSGCAGLLDEARMDCQRAARAAAEAVGQPVIAERYEEHLLSSRFAEGQANGKGALVNPRGRYRTFRHGDYKLVQHDQDGTFLFHLEVGEHQDLSESQPQARAEVEAALTEWIVKLELPPLGDAVQVMSKPDQSREEVCALCKLGYLTGDVCDDC